MIAPLCNKCASVSASHIVMCGQHHVVQEAEHAIMYGREKLSPYMRTKSRRGGVRPGP